MGKKRHASIVGLVAGLLLLAGCSNLAVVHTGTPEDLNLSYEELRYVQYYLGDTVTLELAEVRARSAITTKRTVENEVQDYEKRIVIKRKTPGQAEVVSLNDVRVRFAEDIVLGFRPDVWDLSEEQRDSLGLTEHDLDVDSLTVPPDALEALGQPLPYRLVTFNGQPLVADSLVAFRGEMYTVRFGYKARSGDFIEHRVPRLMYVRNLEKRRVREIVEVEGIKLGS